MPIYKVSYHSMTASYGPGYVEAESPEGAKRKWAGTAFSRDEMGLISAVEVSSRNILQVLRDNET